MENENNDIKFIDLIYREKKFLTDEECQFIIDEYEKRSDESCDEHSSDATTLELKASTFKRIVLNPGTESYDLMFRSYEKLVNNYVNYLDSFKAFHNYLKSSMLYSHSYRVLKYSEGESIHQHIDHSPGIYGSATLQLNDNYSGGDFVFFKGRNTIRLEKGEAMIWPADHFWVHEVKPIISGARYSMNTFLCSVPPHYVLPNDFSVYRNQKPYKIY